MIAVMVRAAFSLSGQSLRTASMLSSSFSTGAQFCSGTYPPHHGHVPPDEPTSLSILDEPEWSKDISISLQMVGLGTTGWPNSNWMPGSMLEVLWVNLLSEERTTGRRDVLLPLGAVLSGRDAWSCSAIFPSACAEANTEDGGAEM